jgi:hypothetical protein
MILEEPRGLDEFKRRPLGRAGNSGIFQHKFECELQFRRIRKVPIHLKTRRFSALTHTDRAGSIQGISERLLKVSKGVVSSPLNPNGHPSAIQCVQKREKGPPPEEPDPHAHVVYVVVSSQHFKWLTKQCEFLGITEQQLIADVLEEWICRNRPVDLPPDPSAIVRLALDEFMRRHRDEFIPVTG